jgi:tryptophan halogenase
VDSWLQVMTGQRLEPEGFHPMARTISEERLRVMLDTLRTNIATAVDKMPTHSDFLKRYCSIDDLTAP